MAFEAGSGGGTGSGISYNQGLSDDGQGLIKQAEELKAKLQDILALKNQVNWEGADKEAAMIKFESLINELNKVPEVVSNYGKFLTSASGIMSGAHSRVTSEWQS